ncbi:RimK/LysX family protein, partial [Photobacterium japonica]|uniref:ATP-dependent zinc protease family protein n=1 Tax=Photobacterium japonica TaxID=2910235 RepID=UPI003D0FDE78
LNLTIGDRTATTEVNLANRDGFSYPLLVGKTFLKGNAWVDAGFDYLREQPNATLIGRKEQAKIGSIPLAVSMSFDNKYSILHAKKIKIDHEKRTVSFSLEGENNKRKTLTLPLYKMLRFTNSKRPMVYVNVRFGDDSYPILVYLRDRSKHSSQLRLGTEALNQFFVVNLGNTDLSKQPRQQLSQLADDDQALMISALESLVVDDVTINATPSATIKTPLLKVERIDEKQADYTRMVHYVMTDVTGKIHSIDKPVKRKIRIGEQVRPIVSMDITLPTDTLTKDIALGKLEKKQHGETELMISPELVPGDLYVNTRSTHLLEKHKPAHAGYIETVHVEGMRFPAKLDTGADISSMDATDIKNFRKNGKSMVTFTYRNHQGAKRTLTREVVRIMKIKARDGEHGSSRPVVNMTVTLGDMTHTVAVNLRDRSRFTYSMILGKNFLRHNMVVSSDRQFLLTKKPK